MSAPNSDEVNASLTSDETHSLGSHEVEDVGNAATSSSALLTSQEIARRIRAPTDPLTKQSDKLCDLMREVRRDTSRRSEETSGLVEGHLRPRRVRFDSQIYLGVKKN